jgi:hypothetical protein
MRLLWCEHGSATGADRVRVDVSRLDGSGAPNVEPQHSRAAVDPWPDPRERSQRKRGDQHQPIHSIVVWPRSLRTRRT